MKIFQIIYSLDMGGIEEFSLNLAGCMSEDNIENHLVLISKCRDEDWCKTKRIKAEKAGAVIHDISFFGRLGKLLKLGKTIRREKPDIIVIHHELNTMRLLPFLIFRKTKIIQIQHSTCINGVNQHKYLCRFFVDKYIGVSDDVSVALKKHLNIPAAKLTVIKNGIDSQAFYNREKDDGITRIVAAGRFVKQKNYLELIRIVRNLPEDTGKFSLTIAGTGETLDEAKKLVGNDSRVCLPGAVIDMKDFFASADIYISYSIYEGLSLTLLEAMASQCAVLTTATGGSDTIENGNNGIVVDIGDENGFARELVELIKNNDRRRKMARNAVDTAAMYDFSKTYESYRKVFYEVTGDNANG